MGEAVAMSRKAIIIVAIVVIIITAVSSVIYFELPVHKVRLKSELVMLGDFNNDHKWDKQDEAILQDLLRDPFSFSPIDTEKADLNRNGLIDDEDVAMLMHLYRYADPYVAEKKAGTPRMLAMGIDLPPVRCESETEASGWPPSSPLLPPEHTQHAATPQPNLGID